MKTRIYTSLFIIASLVAFTPFAIADGPGKPGAANQSIRYRDDQGPVVQKPARPNAQLDVRLLTAKTSFRKTGEYVAYTISVYNPGPVPVYNVLVSSPDVLIMAERVVTVLQPGGWTYFAATRVITAADIQAGSIDHEITATGYHQDGFPVAFSGNRLIIPLYQEK